MATANIDVLKAKSEMLAYLTEETCTMDPELASQLGVQEGQQIKLVVNNAPTKYGLITIDRFYQDGNDNDDIRLRASGRARFDQIDGFDATLFTTCVQQDTTDSWLNENDEFGEFLDETDSSHTDVV